MTAGSRRRILLRRTRIILVIFTVCLLAAGATAIPTSWALFPCGSPAGMP